MYVWYKLSNISWLLQRSEYHRNILASSGRCIENRKFTDNTFQWRADFAEDIRPFAGTWTAIDKISLQTWSVEEGSCTRYVRCFFSKLHGNERSGATS